MLKILDVENCYCVGNEWQLMLYDCRPAWLDTKLTTKGSVNANPSGWLRSRFLAFLMYRRLTANQLQ